VHLLYIAPLCQAFVFTVGLDNVCIIHIPIKDTNMHGPCITILDDPLRALPQRMDLLNLDPSDNVLCSMRQRRLKSTN
jgi:hypothetical protein